jgi:hypothetical protein
MEVTSPDPSWRCEGKGTMESSLEVTRLLRRPPTMMDTEPCRKREENLLTVIQLSHRNEIKYNIPNNNNKCKYM